MELGGGTETHWTWNKPLLNSEWPSKGCQIILKNCQTFFLEKDIRNKESGTVFFNWENIWSSKFLSRKFLELRHKSLIVWRSYIKCWNYLSCHLYCSFYFSSQACFASSYNNDVQIFIRTSDKDSICEMDIKKWLSIPNKNTK